MGYYSATSEGEIVSFTKIRMQLKRIALSKLNQKKKDKSGSFYLHMAHRGAKETDNNN